MLYLVYRRVCQCPLDTVFLLDWVLANPAVEIINITSKTEEQGEGGTF